MSNPTFTGGNNPAYPNGTFNNAAYPETFTGNNAAYPNGTFNNAAYPSGTFNYPAYSGTTGGAIALTSAAAAFLGSPLAITFTAITDDDISAGVFGVEYGIGRAVGYVFSYNTVGAVANQSISIDQAQGIAAGDVVNARVYYNLDALDDPSTRVYGSNIVPIVGVRGAPTGTVSSGQTLTVGSAAEPAAVGKSGMAITYQWQQDNAGGGTYSDIVGATSATLALVDGYIGNYIRCVVTETNSAGAASVNSAATATPVASAYTPSLDFSDSRNSQYLLIAA